MDSIEQRRWLETRTARITAAGVEFRATTPLGSQAWLSPFETILASPAEFTEQQGVRPVVEHVFLGLGLIFFFVSLVLQNPDAKAGGLVWGGICLLVGAAIWLWKRFPRHQVLQLSGGEYPVLLFYEARHRADVDSFAQSLAEACDAYIRNSYDPSGGYESKAGQIERLEGLRDRGSLTEEEFESLKAELVGKTPGLEASGQYI